MTDVLSCPDQATLQRLLAGQVPDELAADLEQHLLDCPHCCQRVRELSSSDAGEGARAARAALELSDEQAVIEVADRAATLRLPGGSTAFTDTVAAANEHTADGWDFRGVLGPSQAEGELGHFGGYRVLRVLGVGGMGLVWEAEDPQLRRRVALKVMKPALANQAEHRERFLREARAAAAIDHSHIVTVYQVGEHRGLPFLAMQLLHGETLDDLLRREGRLPPAECLRIGRQMAEALGVAHRRGLIHRDVKPANTWLEADGGWVKLVDFGLAHALEDDSHLTQTGTILGTPAYMSPEQARGEAVDARSDLFSLGAVLYRMTTSVGPFKGPSTMAVLMSLGLHHPDPPRELNPDISPEFSDLIMRLMAKDPAGRPATAEAVVQAIRGIEVAPTTVAPTTVAPTLRGGAPVAKGNRRAPPSRSAGSTGRRPRWPWVVAAAGAAAMLLAGIVVIIRDKDGKILGTHTYPDADSAEVRHTDSAATAKVAPTLRGGQEPVAKDDPDQSVVKWVRSLGGTIGGGNAELGYVIIKPDEKLPAGRFDLVTADLFKKQVSDADLARFDGLKHLTGLMLQGTAIGDRGIAKLGNLPELTGVYIGDTNVGDEGLRDLTRRFPKIEVLHAGGTKITDAGVPALLAWKNIQELRLGYTAITDESIDTLAELEHLREAFLARTSITRAGIDRLRTKLPDCTIESSFGTFPARGKTQDRIVAEWAHGLRGTIGLAGGPTGWVNVGPDDALPDFDFELVTLGIDVPIADADLTRFNGLRHFGSLGINGSPISDAGIANLGNLPELAGVYIGQSNVGDEGLRDLARRFPKIRVLHAGATKITDAGVPAMLAWKDFLVLGLPNQAITDKSIDTLAKLKYLRAVWLGGTSITRAGIERLHAARPYCAIVSDFGTIAEPPIEGAASLRFNGINEHVDIPTLRYDASHPITIEASVHLEPPLEQYGEVVSNLMTEEGPPGTALRWNADSGWNFVVKTQDHRSINFPEPEHSPTKIAGVLDGRKMSLYCDGKRVAVAEYQPAPSDAKKGGHFVIGATQTIDGQFRFFHFLGVIDEVRISDVARYDGDYEPVSRFEPDEHTMALYHFDEGESQVLHDASGHGHHGKITGGLWVKARPASSSNLAPTQPNVAPTLRGGEMPVAQGDRLSHPSSRRAGTGSILQPPPLEKWLEGRKLLTVSQDGRGQFKTIQEALDALQPGQAVEVLDRGPYRETVAFGTTRNCGLISRAGAVIELAGKRKPTWEKDAADNQFFDSLDHFRLSGLTFAAQDLSQHLPANPWLMLAAAGDLLVERCRFIGGEPNNGNVGVLVYWTNGGRSEASCVVRECRFDTALNFGFNPSAPNRRQRALIERNWFRSTPQEACLIVRGAGDTLIIRHNLSDGTQPGALHLLDTAGMGRLEISNNSFLSGGVRLFGSLNAAGTRVRNNFLPEGIGAEGEGAAKLAEAARAWQVGGNIYLEGPSGSDELPLAATDFVAKPQFLSRDAASPDYLRLASDSEDARRGAGGDWPRYVGALPPGPAPAEGDWLTRWIDAK